MAGRLNLVVFWAVITTREGTRFCKGTTTVGSKSLSMVLLIYFSPFLPFFAFFKAFGVVGACGTEPPLPVCSPVSAVSTLTIL